MKAALLIVLSLSALAFAGPAFNTNTNNKNQIQQHQYMSNDASGKQTQAIETLKQWCYSSQMSQPELTASFKKLVGIVETSPEDQSTEAAVMSERICQQVANEQQQPGKSAQGSNGPDAQAHELIKDVYMDSLIACQSRTCMKQLIKIINSNKVDAIRASYYMTRIAVTDKDSIKEETEVKQLAESFINGQFETTSEAIERQKLFAVTALIGKSLKVKVEEQHQQAGELKQIAEQVAKTIVERYIKPVSQQEVEQYQEQEEQQVNEELSKKIAKRSAALKALANIPGFVLKECQGVEQTLVRLVEKKNELSTVRQSAIECLEQNSSESVLKQLKQITFDQEEPIEVRVAAYRALMTSVWAQETNQANKQQVAEEIVGQVVRHCEQERNQQQDDQFVLYAISHLDNLRSSQQPEHQAIKECIAKNKQHYMQIQLLCKKFKQQLSQIRKSSRNYKLEQEFNQLDSGLVIEGDLIYESKHKQQQQPIALPKLVRVNMSMPVMGETVNVVEITLRQDQMDEELLSVLKIAKSAKFNSESMSKVVDSFKSSVERNSNNKQQTNQQAEADLTIKVDGCTVVYLCLDDFKSSSSSPMNQQRNKRSVYSSNSIVDEIIEHLKRKPVAFNRGFNFNLNERLAKVLDVEANVIAGLRFESRASGQSSSDFEIVAQVEPRFAFEAIVGPAKITNKKLLQRLSTKTSLGLRLRFKSNELVDFQVDLPMNTMELFTIETQMVEKSVNTNASSQFQTYNYLPESIYGQEDIYSPDEEFFYHSQSTGSQQMPTNMRKFKRSIFESSGKQSTGKQLIKLMQGKRSFASQVETPEEVARATGLRGKLRVVASPKDMSFLCQAVAQKYEPRMQGYRVQVQQSQRGPEQKQYILTVSTPNSSIERQMQVRLVQQTSTQRTFIKTDIQTVFANKQMSSSLQLELIHDGRQYAVKAELATQNRKQQQQQRHSFEAGIQQQSQSSSGRLAATYKPYVSIQSTQLKRPIQMQGVVSYQEEPKSVISYEFKCNTSGDFVQGKIILDERQVNGAYKRSTVRRSMQSPIERVLANDITLTSELVAKVAEHAVKVHQMIDWDANKWSLQADLVASHKNQRKVTDESQVLAKLKLDKDQQMVSVERKSAQEPRDNYRLVIQSDSNTPKAHQLVAEIRYTSNKRAQPLSSLLSYKHQVQVQQHRISNNQQQQVVDYTVQLIDTERQINEKLAGRTQVRSERNMKTIESQLTLVPNKAEGKIKIDFVSAMEHQIEFQVSTPRFSHKTSLRADKSQWACQSATQKDQQMVGKLLVELVKPSKECKVIVEVPAERVHFAADLKLESGKRSSLALQSDRFSAQTEFAFDHNTMSRSSSAFQKLTGFRPLERLHLKGNLKDVMRQEAYWMDSQWSPVEKSYLRFDSPIYRSDLEFEPRQQLAKLGVFARSKRSPSSHKQLYDNQESMFYNQDISTASDLFEATTSKPMELANKLWMVRSVIGTPSQQVEQLKQKARRALFEYADRRQSQKHQLKWSPSEQRVNFAFERQPSEEFVGQQQPMRLMGDFTTDLWMSEQEQEQQRPSTLNMESEWINFGLEAKPFDGSESYAKLVANSRHRRSPFAKHESEISYKKHQGYKAQMKHQDSKERRHSWQLEADESPKKWAKMSYESDSKLGKGQWEHQWRKQLNKRSHDDDEQQQVYANKIHFQGQGPRGEWSHQSHFDWEEPSKMFAGRVRRDIFGSSNSMEQQRRYNAIDYLKHVNARFNSQQQVQGVESPIGNYKLDFDYQPESHARLALNMPNEMLHQSSIEFQPTERLYKIQSKLINQRTNQPSYEFLAATKPVSVPVGLGSQEQEPVFVVEEHPMLERPVSQRLVANLFKQPLKLDYSDLFGRQARLDYDFAPQLSTASAKYAGLRQKRAAIFYKDSNSDFEHQSTFDFYPEPMLAGGFKHGQRQSGDFALKAQTKFGPVQLRADSTDSTLDLELESPVANAKLTTETVARQSQLIKFEIDNKHSSVKLAKIVRQTPVLKELPVAHKLAKQLDQARFEHQTELLVSLVNNIFKLKSQSNMNERSIMTIEGELNKQQDKAFVKINGERVEGQLVVDLANKSAQLVLDVDDKRTLSHQTRLVRTSDKFYSLDTITSHKQRPMFKLQAKICAMMFEEPEHLFASTGRHSYAGRLGNAVEHLSTFEAQLYEPKQMQVSGQYDCLKKEARIVTKDLETKKIQTTTMKYDDQTETLIVDARLSAPYGQIYTSQAKLSLPGLMQETQCHRQACQSEIIYSSPKTGNWSARYQPGEQIFVNSPHGKQTINLVY